MKKLWASIASVAVLVLGFGLVSSSPASSDIPGLEYRTEVYAHQGNAEMGYEIFCPTGKTAISGGFYPGSASADLIVISSHPNIQLGSIQYPADPVYSSGSWMFRAQNTLSYSRNVHVFVVCADIS